MSPSESANEPALKAGWATTPLEIRQDILCRVVEDCLATDGDSGYHGYSSRFANTITAWAGIFTREEMRFPVSRVPGIINSKLPTHQEAYHTVNEAHVALSDQAQWYPSLKSALLPVRREVLARLNTLEGLRECRQLANALLGCLDSDKWKDTDSLCQVVDWTVRCHVNLEEACTSKPEHREKVEFGTLRAFCSRLKNFGVDLSCCMTAIEEFCEVGYATS